MVFMVSVSHGRSPGCGGVEQKEKQMGRTEKKAFDPSVKGGVLGAYRPGVTLGGRWAASQVQRKAGGEEAMRFQGIEQGTFPYPGTGPGPKMLQPPKKGEGVN